MTTEVRRVGIIGLGKMGLPMARHLRKAGFEVGACDISAAARASAKREGVRVVGAPRDVATGSLSLNPGCGGVGLGHWPRFSRAGAWRAAPARPPRR
jgi:UDP-N-acetylmuramoylalanine-D-glutamate ligase